MKTRLANLSAALATALLAGSFLAGSISAGEKEKIKPPSDAAVKLANADNAFGLKLFKKLHKEGSNTFISPTSIATAVQMAGQAAAGDTRAEMDKAMELAGINTLEANKDLMAELQSRHGVKLAMANSIWADPSRINMNPEYVKEVQDYFSAEARVEDFSDPKTKDVINSWIAGKTNDLIKDMLDGINPNTVTYLINAIYFKGDWTDKFKKENTKDADFNLADGSTKPIKLMSRKDEIKYAEDDKAQIACLPYGKDGNSAMWIVLPKEGTSLDALVTDLSEKQIRDWQKRAWEREGTLKLPRFKLRFKKELNDCMKDVGIEAAFDMGKADFTRMGESKLGPIFIGRVLHEAVVIVNEEGTEAAAATIIEMKAGSAPPKPFSMTCDRPFLFFITDEPTGAILFMGTCYNPDNPE